jgi:hypothetical protein
MTSICLKVHVYKKKISPRFLIGAINGCDRYGSWIDNYLCWLSVSLVEETGVPEEIHQPAESH